MYQPCFCLFFKKFARLTSSLKQQECDAQFSRIIFQESHIDTVMYRNALQIHVPRTGTDVDVILAAVEEYLMMLAKKRINTKCFKTKK